MMPENIKYFEGRKFLWDGEEYESEEKARSVEKEYAEKGFEVSLLRESEKALLYTRRVGAEVVVDQA